MGTPDRPEPDPALAAELDRLGRRMDAAVRSEQAEYEALAALGVLRDRGLRELALELVHRGDQLTVHAPPAHRWSGIAVYTAGDLMVVEGPGGTTDVHLAAPVVIQVTARVAAGGHGNRSGPAGFAARLHEHAGAILSMSLLTADLPVRGRLVAVARDHAVVDGRDGRAFVSLRALAAVTRPADPR